MNQTDPSAVTSPVRARKYSDTLPSLSSFAFNHPRCGPPLAKRPPSCQTDLRASSISSSAQLRELPRDGRMNWAIINDGCDRIIKAAAFTILRE